MVKYGGACARARNRMRKEGWDGLQCFQQLFVEMEDRVL